MKIVLSKQYWGVRLNREHCAEVPILFGWGAVHQKEDGLECLSGGARYPSWLGRAHYDFWGWRWLFILIPFNVIYRIAEKLILAAYFWLRTGHLRIMPSEFELIEAEHRGYERGKGR